MQKASQGITMDGWAAIELLQADKELAARPGSFATVPEEDRDRLSDLNDFAALAMIRSWTFDEPITVESIRDRSLPDYDTLRRETAEAAKALVTDFSPSPDPASPTRPSSASKKR